MSKPEKKKLSYKERFSQTFRSIKIAHLTLMPLGMILIAACVAYGRPHSIASFGLLIALAAIFGIAMAFVISWVMTSLLWWLFPKQPNVQKMRYALLSIAILAFVLTWMNGTNTPTNAQIDAIHNDPQFMAAIAKMNEQHIAPNAVASVMHYGYGHDRMNRYAAYVILLIIEFVSLTFLFAAFLVIFKAVASLFGAKDISADVTTD